MSNLIDVESTTKDGEPGFKVVHKTNGISRKAVKGRINGRMTAKYPLKAGAIENISIRPVEGDKEFGLNTFRVETFIPFSGFVEEAITDKITDLFEDVEINNKLSQ